MKTLTLAPNLQITFEQNTPQEAVLQYEGNEYTFTLCDYGFELNGNNYILSNRYQNPAEDYTFVHVFGNSLPEETLLSIMRNITSASPDFISSGFASYPPVGYVSFNLKNDNNLEYAIDALGDDDQDVWAD